MKFIRTFFLFYVYYFDLFIVILDVLFEVMKFCFDGLVQFYLCTVKLCQLNSSSYFQLKNKNPHLFIQNIKLLMVEGYT